VVTSSLCWAQAPKLKALAKTATIMIAFKNFNLSRLLSQQVAPVCLGKELQGSNAFLNFFGCIKMAHLSTRKIQSRAGKTCQPLFFDHDSCAFIDKTEQLDYVRIAHPHASMARRVADFVLVFGAVNVNEAVARVRVVLIQAIKP
jgi:hypothetical protein